MGNDLNPLSVAIIGAGYAGMAAAVELVSQGIPATVFEASRTLGGRARKVESKDFQDVSLDNGQHILLGAYSETLRLMHMVHPADLPLKRLPLRLEYPGKLRIAASCLPAPLHLAVALLGAQGLNWAEKFAAVRFMQALKHAHFRLADDTSVLNLLETHAQPRRLRDYLWEPLCIAALNTPVANASAQVFVNVLRDSLAAESQTSDLLLPLTDLSTLFPDAAERYIAAYGGQVLRNTPVHAIHREDHDFSLRCKDDNAHGPYSHVIIAVAPYHLAALTGKLTGLDKITKNIDTFTWEPIITCYLAYPAQMRLPQPMIGHAGGLTQWLFDRGQTGGTPGLFAAVISAQGRHLELTREELASRVHEEIQGIVPDLPTPLWSQTITEKRATFACTPKLVRPATTTPMPGLLLAGDYIASDYPATLESAIRSGINAANMVS